MSLKISSQTQVFLLGRNASSEEGGAVFFLLVGSLLPESRVNPCLGLYSTDFFFSPLPSPPTFF